jgi:hypothetical protein
MPLRGERVLDARQRLLAWGGALAGFAENDVEGPAEDARTVASLRRELNVNALRELELSVRVAELERGRWTAFSIVELEWMTNALVPGDQETWGGETLPEQANAELERRTHERGEALPESG